MKKLGYFYIALMAIFVFSATSASAQNILTNPEFDAGPAHNGGDTYYGSNSGNLSGWTIEGGANANVVQVDGPGGFTYANGPEQDASGAAAGTIQRYLDFGRNNKSVYQTFTARCSANYRFGASFSDRQHFGGSGQTMIVAGNLPTGALVASSPMVTIAAVQAAPYVWHQSIGTVALVAGQVYTYKIVMDEGYMNTDSAFVERIGECAAQTVDVPGDHYQCYRVIKGDALTPEKITVSDQFGRAVIVLARPVSVCNPSTKIHRDKRHGVTSPELHLVCYAPAYQSDKARARRVQIGNQFQTVELELAERSMFCVPSTKKILGERESPLD